MLFDLLINKYGQLRCRKLFANTVSLSRVRARGAVPHCSCGDATIVPQYNRTILNEYVTALLTRQRPDRASRFTHSAAGCFLLDYWTTG